MHGTPAYEIVELTPERAAEWDAFVTDHPDGTFYHLAGWRDVFARAFGHGCPYLAALHEGRIVGVLPLVHIRSPLFGNRLISTAFLVYGGPLATTATVRQRLSEAAIDLGRRLKAGHVEFRSRQALEDPAQWHVNDSRYATFVKALAADEDANLKAIPRKQRAEVRKGIKAGLTSTKADHVETLHHFLALSYRNLGTPAFSKRYLNAIKDRFGGRCQVLHIVDGEEPVGAVMSFFFRDEVLPFYAGTELAARRKGVNDFLYWEVLRHALDRGARQFDFGRSKVGTGAFQFKKHWGFEPQPLAYEYHLYQGDTLPDTSPANPKYRLAIAAWKRLPLPVSKRIGPLISGQVG